MTKMFVAPHTQSASQLLFRMWCVMVFNRGLKSCEGGRVSLRLAVF